MNHPLDGARLKVVRAQEHLDALKAEIDMWLHEQPDCVRSKTTPHSHGDPHHTLPQIEPNVPPIRLSTIVGDVVTNTRAALDYIIFQIAIRHFNPPYDPSTASSKIKRAVNFPIRIAGANGYKIGIDGLTKHLRSGAGFDPADMLAEIESAQTDTAAQDTLGWLDHLVNTDKHRMPLLTTAEFDHVVVTLATEPTFLDAARHAATFKVPRNREAGAKAALIGNVQMDGQVPFYVALKDLAVPEIPADVALEQIIKTVADIIPRFDQFF